MSIRREAGFTLLEVLLSVAIMSIIAAMSLPVLAAFNDRNNLDLAAQGIASQLRRAGTYSRGVSGDSQWGVHMQSGAVTLYKGASFASRDTAYDEPTVISGPVAVTGLSDVVFSKLSGLPSQSGSVTLTNTNTNDVRTITINAQGMVSY